MVSGIYDAITRLVLYMPGLREITLHLSSMTPFLYVAASACPLLTSLSVNSKLLAFDARIPVEFPRRLQVRELRYHRKVDYEDYFYSATEDGNVEELIRHCSLELEELDINSGRFVLLAPHLSNHTHTLRYLFLAFPWESEPVDYQAGSMMWEILGATLQLEQLIVTGWLPGSNVELPPDRDTYILPKLVHLSGMRQVVGALSKGADIEKLSMCQIFSINQRQITQFVRSSFTTLRELTIEDEATAHTPQELLSFLQSFGVFQNLEYLAISYYVGRPWLGQVEPQVRLIKWLNCITY